MNHSYLLALVLTFGCAVAGPLSAHGQTVRCQIDLKHQCDAGNGCQRVQPTIWNFIDLTEQTISRCDAKGCETYPARFSVSGAFLNIAVPERGVMARLKSDGGSFTEVATLADATLISFGACRRQ